MTHRHDHARHRLPQNRTTFRPALYRSVRESTDSIPNGSRRVRVQIVNANPDTEKCAAVTVTEMDLVKLAHFWAESRRRHAEPAVSCSFTTVTTSCNWESSPVVRFTS